MVCEIVLVASLLVIHDPRRLFPRNVCASNPRNICALKIYSTIWYIFSYTLFVLCFSVPESGEWVREGRSAAEGKEEIQ